MSAGRFIRQILFRQTIVGLSALLVVAVFAHKLIILDWDVTIVVFRAGAVVAALTSAAMLIVSDLHVRRHRAVVTAIVSGSHDIEPDDLARLAALPNALTLQFLFMSAASSALILVPGIRPPLLDDSRGAGLVILTITILAASSLPHFVLTRQATLKLIERAPVEPFLDLLEGLEIEQIPERRITQKLLLAVVPPVALLGVGAVLVAHAHLRTLTEQTSSTTAQMIARTALEPSPGESKARETAIAAAEQLGFHVHIVPGASGPEGTFIRGPGGRLAITEPIDDGRAIIRFTTDIGPGDTTVGAIISLFAVLLAAIFGSLFGRALAVDLVLATRSVRLLGTESVIRGGTRVARPARFAVVAELGSAIDRLTDRFRVFAAAQERALEARLAAQRMRGLLFASVSHDLKGPLNAILGFTDLLAIERLTASQNESLGLISQRGRELLALIETILDAARVEAGQLQLTPRETEVATLLAEATRKARELINAPDAPVVVEIADDLPVIELDATYGARALAVVIAHALRNAGADKRGPPVRIRALKTHDHGVRIDIEYGRGDVTPEELEALFARQATSRARGLTLGLSLAQSVVELHGGGVEVQRGSNGAPICQIYLPIDVPEKAPRLSSIPALG